MLKHLVLMKFRQDIRPEEISSLKEDLAAMPQRISEIISYEFGCDIRSERSYDFGIVSTFQNVDALKRYQIHPEHMVLLRKIRTLCTSIVACIFEC
jgi:hypothetical protein